MSFREQTKNTPTYLPRAERPQWIQVIRHRDTDAIMAENWPGRHICSIEVREKYPEGRESMRRADGVNPFPNHRE